MFLINKIEKKRLLNWKKKKINFIKYMALIRGDFITVWYINREKEKGWIKFQCIKGICLSVRYNKYNSSFIIKSLMKNISIEQIYCYYSLNNVYINIKKNILKNFIKNSLLFMRRKKNTKSRYISY